MDILLHRDIIEKLILKKDIEKPALEEIHSILRNPKSRFVHSKSYVEFLKDLIPMEFRNEFLAIVTKFADSNGGVESSQSVSFDDEFISLYNKSPSNIVLSIVYDDSSSELRNSVPNLAIFANKQKPNRDWLIIQLAMFHPNKITVYYRDFKSASEIQRFFESIFSIPKSTRRYYIFDRYRGMPEHFDCIRQKNQIYYYTIYNNALDYDEIKLKEFFKRLIIFTTRNPNLLHGRRIIFENFIISSHHSFDMLMPDIDWELDIKFDPEMATERLSECKEYKRRN